jgi:hypothetical protein
MPGDRGCGERLDVAANRLRGPLADLTEAEAAPPAVCATELDYSATVTLLCDAGHDYSIVTGDDSRCEMNSEMDCAE